jgi:transposase
MLSQEEWMDIKDLHRQGLSIRQIAKRTGNSRNTVRSVLREKAPAAFQAPERASKLDPYKPYLKDRLAHFPLSAPRLLEEIRPMGYTGSVDVLRRYLATLRPAIDAAQTATVRFETPPGEQAQVDWAHCGRLAGADGKETPVYAFVMILSFSRMLFVEFTTSMDLPALIRCHQSAFEFFGGWTRGILYDNMKQVRIRPGVWNALFLDFANYYGFTPRTHRPYRPRTKGKVERAIRYLEENFLLGRSFAGYEDMDAQGAHWRDRVANVRTHGTTKQRPIDLFTHENLIPLASAPRYQIPSVCHRQGDREGYVRHQGSRYSIPPSAVGSRLTLVQRENRLLVLSGDQLLTEHALAERPGMCMAHQEHVREYWKLAAGTGGREAGPRPAWRQIDAQAVQRRDLSAYEEAAR